MNYYGTNQDPKYWLRLVVNNFYCTTNRNRHHSSVMYGANQGRYCFPDLQADYPCHLNGEVSDEYCHLFPVDGSILDEDLTCPVNYAAIKKWVDRRNKLEKENQLSRFS